MESKVIRKESFEELITECNMYELDKDWIRTGSPWVTVKEEEKTIYCQEIRKVE